MVEKFNPASGKGIQYENINDIRNRFADTLLIYISIFGAPIVFISFLRFIKVGGALILSVHLFLYLLFILGAIFRKKSSVDVKYLFIIICTFIMGVTSVIKWGIFGTGVAYFIFLSILATVFYGIKPGVFFTIINLLILIFAAFLFNSGSFIITLM